MACFSPITGYRTAGGSVSVVRKEGYVDRVINIACGRCQGCRLDRAHAWAIRCMHEVQMCLELEPPRGSCFVTLTYDDKHVPRTGSLQVRDFQLFCKRLRKELGAFRFFHCGEYGEIGNRPHYHAILFGIDFASDRIPVGTNAQGDRLYISPTLDRIWRNGICKFGAVTFSSAAYVSRYVMKKVGGDLAAEHYKRFDSNTGEVWSVAPEYATMSRGGRSGKGIGHSWFMKYRCDVFPSDDLVHEGRHVKTPKYYDRLQDEIDPFSMEEVRAKRVRESRAFRADTTADRLAVREELARLTARRKGNL